MHRFLPKNRRKRCIYFSRKSFGVNEIFIKRLKKSFFNLPIAHSKTFLFAKITLLKGLRAKKNRTAILYQNYGSALWKSVYFDRILLRRSIALVMWMTFLTSTENLNTDVSASKYFSHRFIAFWCFGSQIITIICFWANLNCSIHGIISVLWRQPVKFIVRPS